VRTGALPGPDGAGPAARRPATAPMIVTALDPGPRGTGGVRVLVDGAPFATVATQDVADLGVRAGRLLEPELAAALERRAEAFAARAVALRMLAYRPLPGREIERRLTRKGHDKTVAASVVEGLRASGLVNDVEFARHFVRTRATGRRYGPARLEADLRRLGVDEKTASAAVRDTLAADEIDPRQLLRDAAARKLRTLAGVGRDVQRRRLRAYLLRRGFPTAEILAVLSELRV
jgi:regulatory protein